MRRVLTSTSLVSEPTEDALESAHARAHANYRRWKAGFLEWLDTEGRDPERLRGYADPTVRQTHYKIEDPEP